MKKKSSPIIIWITVIAILAGLLLLLVREGKKPGTYDTFAQCISDSGATFYGAFWCPHCQEQKRMFGKSAKLLPYVECSEPNGKGQLSVCTDAGVTGYPTWQFADGSKKGGRLDFEELATATNCSL